MNISSKTFSITDISLIEEDNLLVAGVEICDYNAFKRLFKPSFNHQIDFMFDSLIYICNIYVDTVTSDVSMKVFVDDENSDDTEYNAELTQEDKNNLLSLIKNYNCQPLLAKTAA